MQGPKSGQKGLKILMWPQVGREYEVRKKNGDKGPSFKLAPSGMVVSDARI